MPPLNRFPYCGPWRAAAFLIVLLVAPGGVLGQALQEYRIGPEPRLGPFSTLDQIVRTYTK